MILHLCIRVRISLMDPGSWHCFALPLHAYIRTSVYGRERQTERKREKKRICVKIYVLVWCAHVSKYIRPFSAYGMAIVRSLLCC